MIAPIIIGTLVLLALYAGSKRFSGPQLALVIAFAVLGTALTLFPGWSTWAAHLLNVGRGTDLILYMAILSGAFLASNFYLRFRKNEEAMASLARRLAIEQAEKLGDPQVNGPRGSLKATGDPLMDEKWSPRADGGRSSSSE